MMPVSTAMHNLCKNAPGEAQHGPRARWVREFFGGVRSQQTPRYCGGVASARVVCLRPLRCKESCPRMVLPALRTVSVPNYDDA